MGQSYDHPTRTMGPQAGKTTASHWIGAPDLMTHMIIYDVEAGWRISVSVNWVIIGLCHVLTSMRYQTITLTDNNILWIGTSGTNFTEIRIKIQGLVAKKIYQKRRNICKPSDFGINTGCDIVSC